MFRERIVKPQHQRQWKFKYWIDFNKTLGYSLATVLNTGNKNTLFCFHQRTQCMSKMLRRDEYTVRNKIRARKPQGVNFTSLIYSFKPRGVKINPCVSVLSWIPQAWHTSVHSSNSTLVMERVDVFDPRSALTLWDPEAAVSSERLAAKDPPKLLKPQGSPVQKTKLTVPSSLQHPGQRLKLCLPFWVCTPDNSFGFSEHK